MPQAGDAPAHLYRTLLLREGAYLWDNLWYAGHYPFVSYSLLYYPLAAAIGNVPLVLAAAVASALLFASLTTRAWGRTAHWPSRTFAVLATGPLVLGHYPYALGLAAALAALKSLQAGRTWTAVAASALTLGFSPLAFLFLCLVLVAVVLTRRRLGVRGAALATALLLLGALQLLTITVFPAEQTYYFAAPQLATALATCVLGAALAVRGSRGDVLAAFFVVWGLACVIFFLVPTAVGVNVTRLRWHVLPLVLVAALQARFRPRWLAASALGFLVVYNVVPYEARIRAALGARTDEAAFWAPALGFLDRRSSPTFRVEVVPTGAHWEAYHLPRAGFPLARGWYRQLDLADNGLLYEKELDASEYRAWLRARGVRYVVLADVKLDGEGAQAEATLLRSGWSGLVMAARGREWAVYELPSATPILTGPGRPRVTVLGHERMEGWTRAPGTFRLRVRYMPYWRVSAGRLCLERATDGMTLLDVRRPGRFALVARKDPGEILRAIRRKDEIRCGRGNG